jgi:cyclophilin family peptidyl-prolyl cis-trans isomerase
VKHDRIGIVGMANEGKHTNASQFYITLAPAPWMDYKFVAFGRVIDGYKVLSTLDNEKTDAESPSKKITIENCSTWEFV